MPSKNEIFGSVRDLSRIGDAREWAAAAAADFGMAAEEAFEVKLATSEAVTNAIVHGSRSDADLISLEARAESGALVFEVHDRGIDTPLAPEKLIPPRAEELAEGGRGLELVEMVMDEVELTRRDDGSVLRYVKRRAA